MQVFALNNRQYGYLSPCVIAEIGVNHEGDLERAKRMVSAAARGGAHAAKFQTYKAEKLAAPKSSPAYWDRDKEPADSQFVLFQRWDSFGLDEYRVLAAHCGACGIDFLSTPFDLEAVDMLNPLVPAIKIASADVTNVPLLRKVAAIGKPVVMSTGAAEIHEIRSAIDMLVGGGAGAITLLHCVLNYPTTPPNAQLAQIAVLQEMFGDGCAIGYSDHVVPEGTGAMPALEMAALMGATVIEKHFTDDKTAAGNDHYHAMDESDLAGFTRRLGQLRELYGTRTRDLTSEHAAITNARRRIVAARDIVAGQALSESDLVALRSNCGIEIARWNDVIGREARRGVRAGAPIDWADLT